MTPRNLDVLKWVAAVAMLVDHLWLHVFGATHWSEAAGSLAFPLFAVALAQGVVAQQYASRVRTLGRLLAGAVVAQVLLLMVRDFAPLNVICTLGAGVAIDSALRYDAPRPQRFALLTAAALAGFYVEYLHFGVLFVSALCWLARSRSQASAWVSAALFVLVAPLNGNWWALAAFPVALLIFGLPRDLPRVRNAFYYVYCMQWPLIALMRAL